MRHLVLSLSVLALAACSANDGAGEEGAGQGDAAQPAVDAPALPGTSATIDLQATGLVIPPQMGTDLLEVPFGSLRAGAETSLAVTLGDVRARTSNDECPAGPLAMTEYEGLTLTFQDDRLVGWSAHDPYLPEATRGDMLAAGEATMFADSSLGEEFTIGQDPGPYISGMFDGGGDDAHVEMLWAGTNCIFR